MEGKVKGGKDIGEKMRVGESKRASLVILII